MTHWDYFSIDLDGRNVCKCNSQRFKGSFKKSNGKMKPRRRTIMGWLQVCHFKLPVNTEMKREKSDLSEQSMFKWRFTSKFWLIPAVYYCTQHFSQFISPNGSVPISKLSAPMKIGFTSCKNISENEIKRWTKASESKCYFMVGAC